MHAVGTQHEEDRTSANSPSPRAHLALLLLALACVARGDDTKDGGSPTALRPGALAPSPAEARLEADVSFLAADARDGRAPGTDGIESAAQYIASAFQKAGLKPAAGANGYFQPFTINGNPTLGAESELAFAGPRGELVHGTINADYQPLAIGTSAALGNVPVVFAGFGITAQDSQAHFDYDDYASIDVKGKLVLIIRREPRPADPSNPFHGDDNTVYATFQHKATNAFQHGAAGVLLVNNLEMSNGGNDHLLAFAAAGRDLNSNIPFVMLTRDFGDKLLAAAGEPSLSELETRDQRRT